MADYTYPTRRNTTYVITSQSPCTVVASDLQGNEQTLIVTKGGAQESFLAISSQVIVTSDTQPSIAPALGSAPVSVSSTSGGGVTPEDVIAILDEQMPWRHAVDGDDQGINQLILQNDGAIVSPYSDGGGLATLLTYDGGFALTIAGEGVTAIRTLAPAVQGFGAVLPEWVANVNHTNGRIDKMDFNIGATLNVANPLNSEDIPFIQVYTACGVANLAIGGVANNTNNQVSRLTAVAVDVVNGFATRG